MKIDILNSSPFRSTRTTDAERRQKREALLLAAVQMFNERGFHATSLDDVAARLGVTKPVIYHHLGNKEQVLLECVRIGLAELREAAQVASRGDGNGLDRLRSFLRRYARIIMNDFGRCIIRTADEVLSVEGRDEFRRLKREIDDALRAMVAGAAADGSAQVADVRIAAFAFAGALNWAARWFRADGGRSAPEMADALVDTVLAGVAAAPESRLGEAG